MMNTKALEQALYLEALRRDEERLPVEAAVIPGAALGALGGYQLGRPVNALGDVINRVRGANPVQEDLSNQPIRQIRQNVRRALRPGFRTAGALGGALLGGLGGKQLRDEMIAESPEARLLAKIQIGQELDEFDLAILEEVATAHYNNLAQFSRGA